MPRELVCSPSPWKQSDCNLHELMPNAAVVAIIVNPNNPQADACLQPHPRDEHYGHSAADGRDQGIVKVGKK